MWRSTKQVEVGKSHLKSIGRRVLQHLLPSMGCWLHNQPSLNPRTSAVHPVPILILHPRDTNHVVKEMLTYRVREHQLTQFWFSMTNPVYASEMGVLLVVCGFGDFFFG